MTEARRTQVAVLGAGPAGMAAATELAKVGGRVVVIDEAARAGGQIFRQPPRGYEVGACVELASPNHERGHALLTEVGELEIEVLTGALVWDAGPGWFELEVDGARQRLEWEYAVLATGAYDRSLAFPGWTLPGVITAGAAQVLVRGFAIEPGRRALVAGTGPLLLPTVAALLAAEVEVVAALEVCTRRRALRAVGGVLGSSMRRREAWHYARLMLGRRVDYRPGWALFEARGDEAVSAAVIGKVDGQGRPRRETAIEVDVDLICVGYGLLPQIEVARLLGCEMRYHAVRGGWLPVHDPQMKTSVSGVYVAGEIAGIGGADVAIAEGALAGLAIAAEMALPDAARNDALRRAGARRVRERRASDAMLAAFALPPGLAELATDDTIVCRCEDVSLAAVREAAELYGSDLRAVKMGCRAGMGPCQGRICQPLLHDLLVDRLRLTDGPPPCPVVQVPIKPVSVETMLSGAGE